MNIGRGTPTNFSQAVAPWRPTFFDGRGGPNLPTRARNFEIFLRTFTITRPWRWRPSHIAIRPVRLEFPVRAEDHRAGALPDGRQRHHWRGAFDKDFTAPTSAEPRGQEGCRSPRAPSIHKLRSPRSRDRCGTRVFVDAGPVPRNSQVTRRLASVCFV